MWISSAGQLALCAPCVNSLHVTEIMCCTSLLRRLPRSDADSGQQLFIRALRAFNTHFFQCETCQSHFAEVLAAPAAAAVRRRDDAVLWLWTVHNQVGE